MNRKQSNTLHRNISCVLSVAKSMAPLALMLILVAVPVLADNGLSAGFDGTEKTTLAFGRQIIGYLQKALFLAGIVYFGLAAVRSGSDNVQGKGWGKPALGGTATWGFAALSQLFM